MAFPTTSVLDNFNRTNSGTLGSSWTAVFNNLSVSSNQCAGTNAGDNGSYYNVANYGPNMEVYCDIPTMPASGEFITLWGRDDEVNINLYYLLFSRSAGTDEVALFRVDGGAATQLGATISQEFSAGDSVGMSIIGSTLTAYRQNGGTWASLGTRTDTTYSAAGYVGLLVVGTTARIDNFGGGTEVAASGKPYYAYAQQ